MSDEQPRVPAGSPEGGQWTEAETTAAISAEMARLEKGTVKNNYGDLVSMPADAKFVKTVVNERYHAMSRDSGGGFTQKTRIPGAPGVRVTTVVGWKHGFPVKEEGVVTSDKLIELHKR